MGMTILTTALILAAVMFLMLGKRAGGWLFGQLQLSAGFFTAWSWLRWPLLTLMVLLSASVGYWALPVGRRKFRLFTVGSVAATLFWILASVAFSSYVKHFGRFNATYGSIGGVIILLTWFYLSAMIFLVGGVINATLEGAGKREPAFDGRKFQRVQEGHKVRWSRLPAT
jgi:membrane protein